MCVCFFFCSWYITRLLFKETALSDSERGNKWIGNSGHTETRLNREVQERCYLWTTCRPGFFCYIKLCESDAVDGKWCAICSSDGAVQICKCRIWCDWLKKTQLWPFLCHGYCWTWTDKLYLRILWRKTHWHLWKLIALSDIFTETQDIRTKKT